MKYLGKHIIAEFFGAPKEHLDNLDLIKKVLEKSADLAGATIVNSNFHKFSPQGVTGILLVEESHFSIHTWPEHNYAALDLFTCSDKMDYLPALEYIFTVLDCKTKEIKVLDRGLIS